jgi:predicted amidohydrolase
VSHFRVASLQYYLRPVATFDAFADQVRSLAETAADYKAKLLVFPEYFSVQLLTLGDVKRPIQDQVRDLAKQADRVTEVLADCASREQLWIVGGTVPVVEGDTLRNECRVFGPDGRWHAQQKLHMTRFEKEEWLVSPGQGLKIFAAPWGKFAVAICYDAEFPELARAAALQGADVLVVPSCTDDRQGFLRVRYCAHARAIENQMYVITSSTVGSLPMVPAVHLNYGQAAILTPSDFAFARDGILAEGSPNQEMMVIGDLDLEYLRTSRVTGTVLPLRDAESTASVLTSTELIAL